MATDRMYLRCSCGSEFAIARYLFPPWYAYDNLSEQLTAWFAEHEDCDMENDLPNYPSRPTLVLGLDGMAAFPATLQAGPDPSRLAPEELPPVCGRQPYSPPQESNLPPSESIAVDQ